MTTDQELDDGLAAFDRLGQEMAQTNLLIQEVRVDLKKRHQHERNISKQLEQSLEDAVGASQKALQASKIQIRHNLSYGWV